MRSIRALARRLSTIFASRRSAAPRDPADSRRKPLFEGLEERLLLSTVLYIDYGDAFPSGMLTTTVAALDNTTNGTNPNIDGPRLTDPNNANYADATAVTITSFNTVYGAGAATARATMNELVRRFYEPFDITVVDLTTTAQTVHGHSVQAATSLADVSATLGVNEGDTENNDSYVIVGLFAIGPTGANPPDFPDVVVGGQTRNFGYGGMAAGTDFDTTNNNDGTAFVMLRPTTTGLYSAAFLGDQIGHEAGHLFSLRHTWGNVPPPGPPAPPVTIDSGLLQSDLMSYLGYDSFGGFNVFSRFPMVIGDGNNNNDVLAETPTPYDDLANDPNIGPSAMAYVTGTGQNDIITIAKTGANQATVSVQAFTNANFTGAIEVPGTAVTGSIYSYTIALNQPILVDAGARNDRIVLDGDLGVTVNVRGMHGQDEVVVLGKNAASGRYVPGTNTANGRDGNPDLRGAIVIGSTTINFQEFEAASGVTVSDVQSFTFRTPLAADSLTLQGASAGQSRITGSSGGVGIVPFTFFNVATLSIDTATNDGGGTADELTVAAGSLGATGLTNLTFDAGGGDDRLIVNAASYLLPVGGGTFSYLGGGGLDEVRATADAGFTLTDTSLAISSGGAIALASVGRATVNGGGNANAFVVSGWTGEATLRGAGGSDSYTVNLAGGAGEVAIDDLGAVTDTDTVLVNGLGVADVLEVAAGAVTRGGEAVTFAGVEQLTVDTRGGNDEVTVLGTGPATTILGNLGDDDFFVDAAGAQGVNLDGQDGSDDYTVAFGALAGLVTVADTPAPVPFDRLFVTGTSFADILVVAPAFVTRNGTETVNYSGIEFLRLDAGDGDDEITVEGTGATTTVLGGDGDDDFLVDANGAFTLTLDGQEDSDSYAIELDSLAGPVVVADSGLAGVDSLLIQGTSGDDVIILTDGGVSSGSAGVTFSGIEQFVVNAGDGDDIVDGSALTIAVTIYGGNGNDRLTGGSAGDSLYGEAGDDDLIGNLGADYLDGGTGSDALVGDQGTIGPHEILDGSTATTLVVPGNKLQAVINRAGTVWRLVTLVDEDAGAADTLVGGDGDDYLHGGAGGDSLDGGTGADALFGNTGNDSLAGGDGDDHLYGGSGDDLLNGNKGADIAYGGDGDDTLVADESGDRLIDWFGNFNQFVSPGPGKGAPVIVRSPSPWVRDFLLNLGAADGAANPNAAIRVVIPGGPDQRGNSGR